jgi:cellobiose phosphorylase
MIAETMVGNGDQAYEYYMLNNPSRREEISDLHRCEPYIYAQTIAGRDSPSFGEAKNSWLTGTAAWNYVAITQWILGIHPTYDGLKVSPVIPKHWTGFKASRTFRGVEYKIEVIRKGEGCQVTLEVDGEPTQGEVIPFPKANTKDVRVVAVVQ